MKMKIWKDVTNAQAGTIFSFGIDVYTILEGRLFLWQPYHHEIF